MSGRLNRAARRAASSKALPPEIRRRIEEEVAGHLEDAAAEYASVGYSRRQAESRALVDFGDLRKTRIDLGRVWRGRRVFLFPEAPGEHVGSLLVYDAKALLTIVLIVLLLRWQVVAAYHIPTKSMEPTLHGDPNNGDKILVNKLYYRFFEPERWQIAVFEKDGDDPNLIKRIGATGGETIDILYGDIYITPPGEATARIARKPRDVQDELLVPVFAGNQDIQSGRGVAPKRGLAAWRQEPKGSWGEDEGVFTCSPQEAGTAWIGFDREVFDEEPGISGRAAVGDLALEFRVVPDADVLMVGVELREGEDAFEVRLPVGKSGETTLRRNGERVGVAAGVRLAPGVATRVRFANLDGRITLELSGEEVLAWDVVDPSAAGTRPVPPARIGATGGRAEFRDLTLYRDIHYHKSSDGRLPFLVPPEHCFMLGDKSNNSQDSRAFGSIPQANLVGRPMFVFWPPARLKVVR